MALEAVQAQAGHASIESTRIYLHLADDWLAAQYRKAAEVIDAQVFAGQPAGPVRREPAVSGPRQRGANGMGALPGWAELEPAVPQVAATMRRYLTQIGCVLRPGSVGGADLALRCFRRVPGRGRARGDQHRAGHPPAHRGLQALARRPPRAEQAAADHRDHRPPARHPADVLRPPRRMGLGRGPAPGADVPRRPAPPGPPAAQGPRRRRRRETAARRPERQAPAGARHRGDAAAHRAAGQRVHLPARRRGRADRRRPVAARPGRQAPRGPLPAAAPAPGRPDRRLPRRARRSRQPAAAAAGERPAAGPARRHPLHQQGRRRRRAAPHPPPPAPAHPGHPGDQPRHEPGGDRRDARPPQPGHDPALRQDRQPHRRR